MNNRDKYKKAFSVLKASTQTDWEALMEQKTKKKTGKTAVRLILVAAVICLMTVTVSADSVRQLFGWGGNMEITQYDDGGAEVRIHTEKLTEPVEIRDGRMYFVVNGENMDITDQVSQTKAFTYSYKDTAGIIHDWVVGLNGEGLESYGYAEYLKTDTWHGGYSARVNINADGTTEAQWLEIWKAENNCPW